MDLGLVPDFICTVVLFVFVSSFMYFFVSGYIRVLD